MDTLQKLTGKEREKFLQSKYNYYRTFNTWVVILSCLASVTYFASDCQLFGRFAWETLLPRTFILFPMILFIITSQKVTNYKIMVPFSYVIIHGIMWCTIWAIYYLPIKQHANEGFIIMHLMFFAVAYCAPYRFSIIAHSLVIVNIIVSNFFNHYESFQQMLLLGIPCVVAICAVNYIMENVYMDQYQTKKKLEQTMVTDHLTGVYNRNELKNILRPDSDQLIFDTKKEVSILLMDIDFFKKVNDTYGHGKGDIVLTHTVQIVKACTQPEDIIIRWGGEEFVVIMPDCPLSKALEIGEHIRVQVETSNNTVCPVTISLGASSYEGNFQSAVTNADKALYAAKESGRNRVVCFEQLELTG
jgi:diguanylate cyclase (GGDEF)-like protein